MPRDRSHDNRRVLVVDDNPAIHDDFRKILAAPARHDDLDALEAAMFDAAPARAAAAFELVSAFQGEQAFELATRAHHDGVPFALAFVDMRMPPGWDGLETIEHLWRVEPDLQVVICSAYSDHSWEEIRARLGDRDSLLILKKPFDTVEVVQLAHALAAKWNLTCAERVRVEELEAAVRARTTDLEQVNGHLRDEIQRRAQMEVELRLSQKLEAIGQLAAGIAHEINTPIQYVGDSLHFLREGATDLLRFAARVRDTLDDGETGGVIARVRAHLDEADLGYLDAEVPKAFDSVQLGVGRVASIVQALKAFAHPGPSEAHPADLNKALSNALAISASQYRYVADVKTDFAELPPVVCHASELNQVFLNLIVNAAHAMEDRGREQRGTLGVTTRVDGDDVVVSISDTGVGIPDAVRDRIFDAFFTTKEVGRGTGQGLAISRTIVVDRHGGRLTFDSRVGVGTTFHVRIPVGGGSPTPPKPSVRTDRDESDRKN